VLDFLAQNKTVCSGKRVLDMGCGHGLVGIFAKKYCNAAAIDFQDFNSEVLQTTALPNCAANGCATVSSNFISGDWDSLRQPNESFDHNIKYDVIFSVETLYDVQTYRSIFEFVRHFLAPNGIAVFASKTYYFGVGGGATSFKVFAAQQGNCHIEQLVNLDDGKSVNREIFSLRF
jgi:cyclopropane fatty-acyl-phospholipid synthase-like methyltransferase